MIASNETFVITAYALTWAALLGYLWRLHARDARARAEEARVRGGGPR